jgi:hypothetical protein
MGVSSSLVEAGEHETSHLGRRAQGSAGHVAAGGHQPVGEEPGEEQVAGDRHPRRAAPTQLGHGLVDRGTRR